jgi:diguanylate cyclase (GGDEF)-like protein
MPQLLKTAQASNARLLDRFYSIFLFTCAIFLTVGVPFVFYRKAASAVASTVMLLLVLWAWRTSRRGQPQRALQVFAGGLWLVLVGLIYAGLPPVTAGTAVAMAMMLVVVVSLRAGVTFGATYLAAWLVYIVLQTQGLAPKAYFTGATLTSWFIGAVAMWLVLLPIPELIRGLRQSASLHRAIIEAATDGILVVTSDGVLETYNQRFVEMWAIPPACLSTHDAQALLDLVAGQLADPEQFVQKVRELYAQPGQPSFDVLRFKDGRVFERHSQPQRLDDAIVGRVWTFRDVTERELTQAKIHRLAFHDALTLLPNRRLLHDRLEQALATCRRAGQHGAVLFLDLDNFKPLNDVHGHRVGDMLLVEVACRLTHCVREVDTVARFGGDEFVVVLSRLDAEPDAACFHAGQVAEKIRHTLAQPYCLRVAQGDGSSADVLHRCSSSIGIAMFPEPDASADDVLKRADMAMYRAKDAGRNGVSFHPADSMAEA